MSLSTLTSIQKIDKIYQTGERPVLVLCSNLNNYVTKYPLSSGVSYKLNCELIGSILAKAWHLNVPDFVLIKIKKEHWGDINFSHAITSPALGSLLLLDVVDINNTTYTQIKGIKENLLHLLKIALFDFWVANEDRNYNNSNLMYDLFQNKLIPIDFGCIFNTATFDYPITQLTETDSILRSSVYQYLINKVNINFEELLIQLEKYYKERIEYTKTLTDFIISAIPTEWGVSKDNILQKIQELYSKDWLKNTWDNFRINCKLT